LRAQYNSFCKAIAAIMIHAMRDAIIEEGLVTCSFPPDGRVPDCDFARSMEKRKQGVRW